MRRGFLLLAVVLLGAGGWWFFKHYEITGLEHVGVRARAPEEQHYEGADPSLPPPSQRPGGTLRIASFNIQVFGASKLAKPAVMNVLADVVRQFDVVAIQEVRAKTDDILPRFIDLINSTGRHYDYLIGPRLGRSNSKEQYAYIFDTTILEVDRSALYTVADPDDRLHREPLVAWFRVRGPPPDQAFTFTLVDIHTDPDEVTREVDALADVVRAVRDDGRHEDDIILLGDLNADDTHLGRLGSLPQIMPAISGVPTNTRGTKQYDNLLFSKVATNEYSGRSGVFDLIRQYNLTTEEALQVSDHMPVWGEFSVYEGGRGGQIATRPGESAK
jgi:deoxyribonuclease-1-like protein